MRRLIIVAVSSLLFLNGCGWNSSPAPHSAGTGIVTELEHKPVKYKCVKRNYANTCTKQKLVSAEQFEIDYTDTLSGEEVEVKVSKVVFDSCAVGEYFHGKYTGC